MPGHDKDAKENKVGWVVSYVLLKEIVAMSNPFWFQMGKSDVSSIYSSEKKHQFPD